MQVVQNAPFEGATRAKHSAEQNANSCFPCLQVLHLPASCSETSMRSAAAGSPRLHGEGGGDDGPAPESGPQIDLRPLIVGTLVSLTKAAVTLQAHLADRLPNRQRICKVPPPAGKSFSQSASPQHGPIRLDRDLRSACADAFALLCCLPAADAGSSEGAQPMRFDVHVC